jgi:hypothetical protein
MDMEQWMLYGGTDSDGLNLGYAGKFGNVYTGVYYGGNLIDDLFAALTNGNRPDAVIRTNNGSGGTNDSVMVKSDGSKYYGQVVARNNIAVLVGLGNLGINVGFQQYIVGKEGAANTAVVNNGFKVPVQVGFMKDFPQFRLTSTFRLALQVVDETDQWNDTDSTGATITGNVDNGFTKFGGGVEFTLDFSKPDSSTHIIATLGAEAAYDIYNEEGLTYYAIPDSIGEVYPDSALHPWFDAGTNGFYLGFDPKIQFTGKLTENTTFGAVAEVPFGFETRGAENPFGGEHNTKSYFQLDLGVGIQCALLPDRLKLHGGLGFMLFNNSSTFEGNMSLKPDHTDNALPVSRIAIGTEIHFTKNVAADAMITSTDLTSSDAAKFVFLIMGKF